MHRPLPPSGPDSLQQSRFAVALYLGLALLTRAWAFGNPVVHVDEQFYLVVGQHMLLGDWPYIEIFDRKPFLLFAINSVFALFGDWALIASQLGAMAAAIVTALLLRRIAKHAMSGTPALLAGALYIALLPGFEGVGAQSPLFYTPLVCTAALLTLRALETGRLLRFGSGAMLASGLALQIKYSVVFECGFFGLALLLRARHSGWTTGRIAVATLSWIGCALLPTATIAGGYALAGHGNEFWQANVIANTALASPLGEALPRLGFNLLLMMGPLAAATAGWARLARMQGDGPRFILFWFVAAAAGYLVYGTWYTHYMLPVLAPLALVAAASFLSGSTLPLRAISGMVALSLLVCVGRGAYLLREHGNAVQAATIATAIDRHLGRERRLFIYSGDPGFYRLANSELPHPYAFPDHYSRNSARRFMPIPPPEALQLAFANPPKVVMRVDKLYPDRDRTSDAWLNAELKRNYRQFARLPIGSKQVLLYERLVPNRP